MRQKICFLLSFILLFSLFPIVSFCEKYEENASENKEKQILTLDEFYEYILNTTSIKKNFLGQNAPYFSKEEIKVSLSPQTIYITGNEFAFSDSPKKLRIFINAFRCYDIFLKNESAKDGKPFHVWNLDVDLSLNIGDGELDKKDFISGKFTEKYSKIIESIEKNEPLTLTLKQVEWGVLENKKNEKEIYNFWIVYWIKNIE